MAFFDNPIQSLEHLLLPSLALGGIVAAGISRFVRQSVLDTMTEDFIRTARAKGLRDRVVITRHALKPSLIPVVTFAGLQMATILGGTLVIETVFTWPGIGRGACGGGARPRLQRDAGHHNAARADLCEH